MQFEQELLGREIGLPTLRERAQTAVRPRQWGDALQSGAEGIRFFSGFVNRSSCCVSRRMSCAPRASTERPLGKDNIPLNEIVYLQTRSTELPAWKPLVDGFKKQPNIVFKSGGRHGESTFGGAFAGACGMAVPLVAVRL